MVSSLTLVYVCNQELMMNNQLTLFDFNVDSVLHVAHLESFRWWSLAYEKKILAARARKASENNRARKCTRQNVPRTRTCEPAVCMLRGSGGCNYSRTCMKRHRIKRSPSFKRSVFKVPKITSPDVL